MFHSSTVIRRRKFFKASTGAVATGALALGGTRLARGSQTTKTIGTGDFTYEVTHQFPQLPSSYTWQTTHNVAVDKSQNLYVIHEGDVRQKDHPAIFVFDADGKFVRAFGSEFQGGGHGLEVRQEAEGEFLYVTGYKSIKSFAKLTLQGEQVWTKRAPMQSGVYKPGEDQGDDFSFKRDRFLPTNFGFLTDGGFLLADGYGSYRIHRFDHQANWIGCFGEPGKENGQFNTPHGLTVDSSGDTPVVIVADRANNRLQWLTAEGKHLKTVTGLGLPANVQIQGNLMLVPELYARLSIFDLKGNVLAQLGDDSERLRADSKKRIRVTPELWNDGKFITPHDACFDGEGNIFVAEYVPNLGRVTKLRKLS